MDANVTYEFKVRYKGTSLGYTSWKSINASTMENYFSSSSIGQFMAGGYFAGIIDSPTQRYAVIVAPKASGESSSKQFKTVASADSGIQSMWDG